jgi:signal transduction histidine kinase
MLTAIFEALNSKADVQECRMLRKGSVEAFDLMVRTTPLEVQGQLFVITAITDISHEKRRRVLEHIFFHDIMNTASGINLSAKMLHANPDSKNAAAYRQNLVAGIDQLMDELHSQKELLAAETNELVVQMQPVDGYSVVSGVVEIFRSRFCNHKIMIIDVPDGALTLNTDRGLLHRVLGNMIMNAVEASRPGDVINVSCGVKDGYAEFRVHNAGHLPKEVQLQLFQRSFSTKGTGRGLGTYSMKLLSERYLNGQIDFISSPQHGTTFTARYPL